MVWDHGDVDHVQDEVWVNVNQMKNVEYLKKLKDSEELQQLEWYETKEDPYYFLTNWAYTLDSHDTDNPIKPFPEKEYIKILVDKWFNTRLLLVPKSRQMMVSWIFTGLYLWDTQFNFGRLNFFQSKKADDANDLVRRAKTMWDNEPSFLKKYKDQNGVFQTLSCNPQNQGKHVYNLMTFPEIQSEIRGIPEGGDVIRMQTASGIFADEVGFQPEAAEAFKAAKPSLSSKGRYTGVSTAEDNTFFERAVFDLLNV